VDGPDYKIESESPKPNFEVVAIIERDKRLFPKANSVVTQLVRRDSNPRSPA